MLIYWLLVLVPMLFALREQRNQDRSNDRTLLGLLMFVLLVVMGFRQNSGDFSTYEKVYEIVRIEVLRGRPFTQIVTITEPIYGLFNWVSVQFNWGICGVNTLCALVFLGCLWRCASGEPSPLFFTALSIPYFVIVVGMGYTRQGLAAGLIMLGIQSLRFGKPWLFGLQIMLAAGFHTSAFAFLPAVLFAKLDYRGDSTKMFVRILIIGIGVFGAYNIIQEQYGLYVVHYGGESQYKSSGAFLRSIVTGAAAIMFFGNFHKWRKKFADEASLLLYAFAGLAVVPLSLVASTPADRMGLYLIPFQLIVFGRLPFLQNNQNAFERYRFGIAVCYIAYFAVWLHLGAFAQQLWVPYKSALW